MIKENDLRVGNWVKGIAMGLNHQIDLHFFNEAYDDETMLDWYSPIPLTNELLEKCNAVKDNYGLFYLRRDGSNKSQSGMDILLTIKNCLINDDWVWDCSVGDFKNIINLCYIKHLHQLQNLVYSLTGVELEVVW